MIYENNKAKDVRIAYIGGGSRGWAWGLMSDLVAADDISGTVALYDIDKDAAKANEVIGKKYNSAPGAKSEWNYVATDTLEEALTGANFVVISILPGTFDEMHSDVHSPEKYGIYQAVGDTVGPGGIVRAMRTIPMFEVIAKAIEKTCPDAWVINYTNPMTVCVRTLYRVFPKIKAFGCCHEVFGTQKLLAAMLEDKRGIKGIKRPEIKVNVTGINHFTWLTDAQYRDIDLLPLYAEFAEEYAATGYTKGKDENWFNNVFDCSHRVKFELFRKYGYIAAAGDRHLAEFCEGKWFLESPEVAKSWGFNLTTVPWRRQHLEGRLEKSRNYFSGATPVELKETGEDGVNQIRALLGLQDMVTNVNLPNMGQIPNLPLGAVVETNATFRDNSVIPCMAGPLPTNIYSLIARIVGEQELIVEAGLSRDLDTAYRAFINDPLVTCNKEDAKVLFDEMIENTKKYLPADFFEKK